MAEPMLRMNVHSRPTGVPTEGSGYVAASPASLSDEYAIFAKLVRRACRYADAGRLTAAAASAEVAANFAYYRHPGIWVSHDLEEMLLRLGQADGVTADQSFRQHLPSSPASVLHVATRVEDVGGHSRMTWRWIKQDAGRRHSLALTKQGARPIPDEIVRAVAESGGHIYILNKRPGSIISWARQLREISKAYDFVVLNIYADDIIPILAFSDKDSTPPVAFLDQADHAFWLGASVSDVVVSLRESGQRLAKSRRAVDPDRSYLLPIPLTITARSLSRREAKRQLGLPEDSLVILSIARAPKYRMFRGAHYADPIVEVLREFPKARLLVIGPDEDAGWKKIRSLTGGRVTALGTFPASNAYYQAADIYLDSFPVNSITSLLEAASYGVPLISRQAFPDTCGVLGADAPGISSAMIRTHTEAEFTDALRALLGDEARRSSVGEAIRRDVLDAHGDGWRAQLEDLYAYATALPPNRGAAGRHDEYQADDVDLAWSEVYRTEISLSQIESYSVKRLPLDLRLRAFCTAAWRDHEFRPGSLFPEWATGQARGWLNAIKRSGVRHAR
ncbi:MAG: glycosyltransferase [Dehalococcoidia bacterium]